MRVRNHGKYTRMSMTNPRAIARCDYSGLMVQQSVMKKQLAYRGRGLIETGYLVNPKFYDQPNAQDLTPLIRVDPRPILNARPDNEIDAYQPQILILDVSGNTNVTLTAQQFSNINFIFKGALTGNVIISVPATFNDFFVLNETTGGFSLSIQIVNNYVSRILLTNGTKMLICNDSLTLKIIHPN